MACKEDEANKLSDDICYLLFETNCLTEEIEAMIHWCSSGNGSDQREDKMIQEEVVEDGEVLIIEGFWFESATSLEELQRLSSRSGARKHQRDE